MPSQKEVSVGDKKYTLQHPGVRWYVKLMDRNRNRAGVLMQESYISELLEHVVIEPKVSLDDFDTVAELEGLVGEIESFLRSK